MAHLDARSGRFGAGRSGVGRSGAGRSGVGRFRAGLVAAVAAGCATAVLVGVPSWALRQPALRPGADLTVAAVPSGSGLEVVRLAPDAAPPGGTTTIHAVVANRGPDTTASPFTVVVALPVGVTPEGPYFPADCQVLHHGRRVSCVFGPGLPPLRSATALIPVRLDPDLPEGRLRGGRVEVLSADDRKASGNRQPFDIRVVETVARS
ncbi:hypothetical protein ACH4E7_05815 [Kitasatospora sp. NPDC018058]|uniref:hypothetical protein n=1 Tax=Kitasatospora sp. NPDC018058 TaxID=3364025 RepID=UPI0037BF631A